jgi:hypothetical protein
MLDASRNPSARILLPLQPLLRKSWQERAMAEEACDTPQARNSCPWVMAQNY